MRRGAPVNLLFTRLAQLSARGELGVPLAGFFHRSLECAEVDENKSKPLRVSFGPLVVVQQAPGVVSADGNAGLVGFRESAEIAAEESSAAIVRHDALGVGNVAVGAAVLGDLD